jgi:aldose 1-epimerase
MAFQTRSEKRPTTGQETTVWLLEDDRGAARAEVWPALGFNCYRWQAKSFELLHAGPELFTGGKPTRHGIPILFPFPNRIRDGRFTWEGRTYQLPLNGPGGKHAIHGFACQRPWRIVGRGADAQAAWLTGEFQGSVDAPDCRQLWPADYRLRVTYRLSAQQLRIEAEVHNPDRTPLPYGLGYHPYFRTHPGAGATAEECQVEVLASSYWVLEDMTPTGEIRPVQGARDLQRPRPFRDVTVDDVLTQLTDRDRGDLPLRGSMRWRSGLSLGVRTSRDFREIVVFTPPHRESFCIEPYTCATDAINLQQRGVDAGWRVLPPGEKWQGVVELVLTV